MPLQPKVQLAQHLNATVNSIAAMNTPLQQHFVILQESVELVHILMKF